VDLTALDPMREPARWAALLERTLGRLDAVLEERMRRDDPLLLIATWRKPLLAVAAAVILALIPMELALERRDTRAERVERLVALSHWLVATQWPTGADFRRALGGPP
jgi:hypothetical protein